MTKTTLLNIGYYVVFAVIAIGASLQDVLAGGLVPTKWVPFIQGFCGIAMWLKSHNNYFTNPDGTNATVGYAKVDSTNVGTTISVKVDPPK